LLGLVRANVIRKTSLHCVVHTRCGNVYAIKSTRTGRLASSGGAAPGELEWASSRSGTRISRQRWGRLLQPARRGESGVGGLHHPELRNPPKLANCLARDMVQGSQTVS